VVRDALYIQLENRIPSVQFDYSWCDVHSDAKNLAVSSRRHDVLKGSEFQ
jgi:hypothetical protein